MWNRFNHKNKFWVFAAIIGIIVFSVQDSISFIPAEKSTQIAETPVRSLEEISLANMLVFQKESTTTCIDIRDEQFYRYSHIPSAVNLSSAKLDAELPEQLLEKLKSSANIIIYANAHANDELHNAVEILEKKGIKNVKVYSAGWEEWKACKLPVEKSK